MQAVRPFSIRPLLASDQDFLWEMLYQAIYVAPGSPPLPRSVLQQPELAHYAADWGQRPGDLGKVAQLNATQQPVGAAWLRLFAADDPGYGFIAAEIPEISLAVIPSCRGMGIGSALLNDLIDAAKGCYPALSLSVTQGNYAQKMYEIAGFYAVRPQGDALIMRLDLEYFFKK